MKIDTTFLQSKVARRIFLLFVCCALIPITALALLSFTQVTNQLKSQSQRRLQQMAKAVGMSIYERLLLAKTEMEIVASNLEPGKGSISQETAKTLKASQGKHFNALFFLTEANRNLALFGHIKNRPKLTTMEIKDIQPGKTVIFTHNLSNRHPSILMISCAGLKAPNKGVLIGEINTSYLFGIGSSNLLPPMTELLVLEHSRNILVSSFPGLIDLPTEIATATDGFHGRRFEWRRDGEEYLASWWTIFLKTHFSTPSWTVVLSQSKTNVFAPMAQFKKVFPLVALLSLWVVLLLSVIQIRRSLVPLEKLKEGTRRIAARNFDHHITVNSGDEFQELAASFNLMSSRLGKQFNALTTIGEIDRTILTALDTKKIVNTVLRRMQDVIDCDTVGVVIIDSNDINIAQVYTVNSPASNNRKPEIVRLRPVDVQELRNNLQGFILQRENGLPKYLSPLAMDGIKQFLVLPISIKEKLAGIISLGYIDLSQKSEEDQSHARQLADQVAVALSNAHLVDELDQLNWGTLRALARTVDAKSPWTAGHSERVTELALKISKVLGFAPKELEVLHRAGLLHDVGKIGIPAFILDKPGKLTDEEYQTVKQHPRMGQRILEPIGAYAEVIPMVLQHHERFDGKGYPDGLSGEDICLGGRILAVADVYDALVSNRPYRAGWEQERAFDLVRKEAGGHFDPKVVEAFFQIAGNKDNMPEVDAAYLLAQDTGKILEKRV